MTLRTSFKSTSDAALLTGAVAATAFILLVIAVIVVYVFVQGVSVVSWTFLTTPPAAGMEKGGVGPAIVGTAILTVLMSVMVLPVGVITAVYMSEYASRTAFLRLMRLAVVNLAGVPSIVVGLFGLGFLIRIVGRGADRAFYGGEVVFGKPALLWAAITLAILTLPVVIVATEEALRAVPRELRDASEALGATRFYTTFHIVLPHARGGILTSVVLAVSRAAGEVAPLLFTGAAYFVPNLPTRLNDQFMHLGYHVFMLSSDERTRPLLFGTVLVLFCLTLLLNSAALLIRSRGR